VSEESHSSNFLVSTLIPFIFIRIRLLYLLLIIRLCFIIISPFFAVPLRGLVAVFTMFRLSAIRLYGAGICLEIPQWAFFKFDNAQYVLGHVCKKYLRHSKNAMCVAELSIFLFFIVVPCILIKSKFFLPTNVPFINHIKCQILH
jgi:hypothetical protein